MSKEITDRILLLLSKYKIQIKSLSRSKENWAFAVGRATAQLLLQCLATAQTLMVLVERPAPSCLHQIQKEPMPEQIRADLSSIAAE